MSNETKTFFVYFYETMRDGPFYEFYFSENSSCEINGSFDIPVIEIKEGEYAVYFCYNSWGHDHACCELIDGACKSLGEAKKIMLQVHSKVNGEGPFDNQKQEYSPKIEVIHPKILQFFDKKSVDDSEDEEGTYDYEKGTFCIVFDSEYNIKEHLSIYPLA